MAGGGGRERRKGSRDGRVSGPIYRLEGSRAKRMAPGGGRTRPGALDGEVAAGGGGAAHGGRRGKRPRGQGLVWAQGGQGDIQVSPTGPPGSSWPRMRRGRGSPAAYRRAAAETEREMEIGTFL